MTGDVRLRLVTNDMRHEWLRLTSTALAKSSIVLSPAATYITDSAELPTRTPHCSSVLIFIRRPSQDPAPNTMPNLANPAPPLPSFPDQSAASNPLPQQPSPPSHRVLKIARPVTLGLALFLSIPVLGLCAHILSVTTDNIIIDFYFIFTALGVATAVLTIVSVGGL
jgi:hypothetical protein